MTSEPSGRLYFVVTKHWPRIAAGLVIALGLIELVVGGLTADSGVEFYLMAWAGTTGGLWFLFENAETAMSIESRSQTIGWLRSTDEGSAIAALPAQFAALFDEIFGERHLSLGCFARSCLASYASLIFVYGFALTFGLDVAWGNSWSWASMSLLLLAGGMMNFVPDYFSLMETRWLIARSTRTLHLPLILAADVAATIGIFVLWSIAMWVAYALYFGFSTASYDSMALNSAGHLLATWENGRALDGAGLFSMFATTFFTSVWLWLYILLVLVSRLLLRMNSGVGFLLRVTDVERQPFRSIGFVSVIIVSVLFALGLPLVLW